MELLVAVAEVVLAVPLAPLLVALVPAARSGRRNATELYREAFTSTFTLMPVAIAAWAWFAAWRLHVAPSGHAGQPVAIVIGVLFGVQTLAIFYFFTIGAAMTGSQGTDRPPRPRRRAFRLSCSWSYAALLLNLPLALIVAVIRLLA
jgi:hypothetical protein